MTESVERPPAVVLGLSGTAMGVLRSLERLGVETYGVYVDPIAEPARRSRRLRARYRVLDARSETDMLRVLQAIRRHAGFPPRMVLIPCGNDAFAEFVANHRDRLEKDFLFRLAPAPIAESFLDKRATVALCQERRMPIPASFVPHTHDDVAKAAVGARFPVIIKPARHGIAGFPGKNVVVRDAGQLLGFYREHPALIRQSMFQELVPSGDGHLVTVNAYADRHGAVLAQVSLRVLRQWRPDTGAACYAVSETKPQLLALSRGFLEGVGYVGFAQIEYAEDVATGAYRFLELNTRVVHGNQHHVDAGVDLNAIAYLEMCGAAPPREPTQRDGVYWMDIQRDLASCLLKSRQRDRSITSWPRNVRKTSSFAVYDRTDRRPFFAAMLRPVDRTAAAVRRLGTALGRRSW